MIVRAVLTIEIYHAGDEMLNLAGFYLANEAIDLWKWNPIKYP